MSYNITLNKYLDKLAEASPIPGGGSAAALTGALGMSLLSMIARYILKRDYNDALHTKLSKILEFTESSRHRLRKLMNEDEIAYLRLSKGMKDSASDISKLFKRAAIVPLQVCTILQEGIMRCEELRPYCKTSLISDLAEAALLLEAGFLSAKLNVEINLSGIKDAEYSRKIRGLLSKRRISALKTKERILRKIRTV